MSTFLPNTAMEQQQFDYSMKNIPIPNKSEYTKRLIDKTENLIKRMRWKAYFFLNPNAKTDRKETYGFNSKKTPPQIKEMIKFEDDLLKLIEQIEFRNTQCPFQSQLRKDVANLKASEHMFVPADKTNNFYKLTSQDYTKLLRDNTTAKYTKTDTTQTDNINAEAKSIAEKLQLDDRIDQLAQRPAFITIKDHKENFPNRVQCRLINPAKSEIGIISKRILDRINKDLIKSINVNQWISTNCAIKWFQEINHKEACTFLAFDVVEFYPSISQALLNEALEFASKYINISDSDKEIIHHAKKTVLFHDEGTWQKTNPPHLFDVTMGSYDGAETCQLVGTFILYHIKDLFNNEVGLYRDDGLAVLRNHTPSQTERVAKMLISTFKKYNLRITIQHGMKEIDFLDTHLNLNNSSFKPYNKQNNTTQYVNIKSNHPKNILNTIPKSVNSRLTNISSDAQQFNSTKKAYQDALNKAGYDHQLNYNPSTDRNTTRKRTRNIIWFNPPFSKNVKTNIGKRFFALLDKHFPKDNKLHKIFNRNTVKLSYSCTDNMAKIISNHNKNIQRKDREQHRQCNCRIPINCPLNNKCLTDGVVYKATVTTEQSSKFYIGASETTFKLRWSNHMSSFRNENRRSQTALSNYIWTLKENNINFNLNWTVLKRAKAYSNISKRCNLCLWEKYFIITAEKSKSLNSRTELVSKCRHANKFLLSSF